MKKQCKKSFPCFTKGTIFCGYNFVGRYSKIYNSKVGFASYFGQKCTFIKTLVGKYCSIGSNVSIINGSHPTNTFSTHPCFYSANNCTGLFLKTSLKYDEYKYVDEKRYYHVEIGNDVWIGNNVLILQGIRIGDGAVVAAGSVVTKDVEPYSIVGGVPAKIIRKRFSAETIDYLQSLEWWNKDVSWLNENCDEILSRM